MNKKILAVLAAAIAIGVAISGTFAYEILIVPTIPVGANQNNLTMTYYVHKPEIVSTGYGYEGKYPYVNVVVDLRLDTNSNQPIKWDYTLSTIQNSYLKIMANYGNVNKHFTSTQAELYSNDNTNWYEYLGTSANTGTSITNAIHSNDFFCATVNKGHPLYFSLNFAADAVYELKNSNGDTYTGIQPIPDNLGAEYSYQTILPISCSLIFWSDLQDSNANYPSPPSLVQSQQPFN